MGFNLGFKGLSARFKRKTLSCISANTVYLRTLEICLCLFSEWFCCLSNHWKHEWTGSCCFIPQCSNNNTGSVHILQQWGVFVQPLLQWKSNNYYMLWVCVCSLRYTACNTLAPYCHLCPAPLYNIFPHFLINGTIFRIKSIWTQNVCIDFLYNFYLRHFSL